MSDPNLEIMYPAEGMCRISIHRDGIGDIVCSVPTASIFATSSSATLPNDKEMAALGNAKELAKILVQATKQYDA